MKNHSSRKSSLALFPMVALLCGTTCWSVNALAQTATESPTRKPSLSDIDPPRPGPSFHPQTALLRASGAELRSQALEQIRQKFEAADTARTGAITSTQANQARLGFVAKNFKQIDTAQKGSVTFDDIQRYLQR